MNKELLETDGVVINRGQHERLPMILEQLDEMESFIKDGCDARPQDKHDALQGLDLLRADYKELVAALRSTTDALQNMGDYWAYGMAKTEGAQPTQDDHAAVEFISTAARKAVDESRSLLAKLEAK